MYLDLEDGGQIQISDEDYNFVSQFKWKKWDHKWKGETKTRIRRVDKKVYLHRFLFNYENKNLRFLQLNGDEFDYRRENIVCLPRIMSHRKPEKTKEGRKSKGQGIIASVLENRATIVSTKEKSRSLECTICSTLDDEVYMRCLDFCAEDFWLGWGVIDCKIEKSIKQVIESVGDDIIPKYLFEERILQNIGEFKT